MHLLVLRPVRAALCFLRRAADVDFEGPVGQTQIVFEKEKFFLEGMSCFICSFPCLEEKGLS